MKPTNSKEAKMLLEQSIQNFEDALRYGAPSPLIEKTNENMFKMLELFSSIAVSETVNEIREESEASAPSENRKH